LTIFNVHELLAAVCVVSKLFAKKVEKLFDAGSSTTGSPENASTLYRSVLTVELLILVSLT